MTGPKDAGVSETDLLVGLGLGRGDALLSLAGELDLATAGIFTSVLDAALDRRPARIVLDLGRLTFIDAGGVRAIVGARAHATLWGGTLSLTRSRPAVRRVLDLCRVGDLHGPHGPAGPGPAARQGAPALRVGARASAA